MSNVFNVGEGVGVGVHWTHITIFVTFEVSKCDKSNFSIILIRNISSC